MAELDSRHPGYGFARHKGYGTDEHRDGLLRKKLADLAQPSGNGQLAGIESCAAGPGSILLFADAAPAILA